MIYKNYFSCVILSYFAWLIVALPPEFVKIGLDKMMTWYNEEELCMIANSTLANPIGNEELMDKCMKEQSKVSKKDVSFGLLSLSSNPQSNRMRSICCPEEMPHSERGFDRVVKGFEDGRENHQMMDILWELSARNMSMVWMGDSMSMQVKMH